MKLYSISKLVFWAVMVMIVLLPMSRHWRLLSGGERTEGTVQGFSRHLDQNMFGEAELTWASEVRFRVGDSLLVTLGPVDYEMEIGKTIPVYYNRRDPSKNCLFNLSCLYYTSYTILPVILIIVWYAFYLSFNNYRREKKGESSTPASSPYSPFRRRNPNKEKRAGEQGRIT
ncbi:MAG: DUF3592 domain-containing protein [Bacteroidetes bacterium]|nr:DUF3592 domain-containing protein [Bacteroidota bacterium]